MREFHLLTVLCRKWFLLCLVSTLSFFSLRLCPLVILISSSRSGTSSMLYCPCRYLYSPEVFTRRRLAIESLSTYSSRLVAFFQVTFARYLRLIGQCAKTGCLSMLHPALLWTASHLWLQLLYLAKISSHLPPCGRNWTSSSSACLVASWFSFHDHGFLLDSLWRSHLLPDRQYLSWYGMFESYPCVFSCTEGWAGSMLSIDPRSTCS